MDTTFHLSCCWSRTRRSNDYDSLLTLTRSSSKPQAIWKLLLRKINKLAKKKMHTFHQDSKRFSYEACEYAQNFDDHGTLMSNDSEDLSRSFSARFAVANPEILRCKRLVA
ncbi:hypothetical protein Tco_1150627 [Tanacetum coccineum]